MADSKITALTALTAADPVNDMFPVVDVSDTSMAASGTTKRISVNNILSSSPTASGALTVTGLVTAGSATITGDLTVDTSTLKVDSTNDRVGFGTASPAQGVHLSKSSTSTALTSPPVGGASFRIQNTSSTNNNFGSVEFYNAAGLFGASVNCQYTNQATPTSDLVFVTRGTLGGLEHYRIAADGVATWSEVGGVAGTAMTLNSTGLGVGVTPSAWGGGGRAFEIGFIGTGIQSRNNQYSAFTQNSWFNSSAQWIYGATGLASRYDQDAGIHKWFTAPSGTAGNAITFTQAMTLDASGNLAIGVAATGTRRLELKSAGTSNTTFAAHFRDSADTLLFHVRSDGYFNTGQGTLSPYSNTTASAANMFVDSSGFVYRSTSSLKYKTDVKNSIHGLADVLKLRSVTYKSKNGDDTVFGGLIAEEVHAAGLTEFVAYAPDKTPDSINYGNMVALLVSAIQELTARVQTLETR